MPPRVNAAYGSGVEELLALKPFRAIADISPGLLKVNPRTRVYILITVSCACIPVHLLVCASCAVVPTLVFTPKTGTNRNTNRPLDPFTSPHTNVLPYVLMSSLSRHSSNVVREEPLVRILGHKGGLNSQCPEATIRGIKTERL